MKITIINKGNAKKTLSGCPILVDEPPMDRK